MTEDTDEDGDEDDHGGGGRMSNDGSAWIRVGCKNAAALFAANECRSDDCASEECKCNDGNAVDATRNGNDS